MEETYPTPMDVSENNDSISIIHEQITSVSSNVTQHSHICHKAESTKAKSRPYHRHDKCYKPTNIVELLRHSEMVGSKRRFSQLPKGFVEAYQSRFKHVWDVPVAIHGLFQLVKSGNLSFRCSHFQNLITTLHEATNQANDETEAIGEVFYSGGVELCADILSIGLYDRSKDINEETAIKVITNQDREIVRSIIQIMHSVGRTISKSMPHLCKNPYLLHLLFSLLAVDDSRLYSDATILLEEMLLSDPKSVYLDMRTIPCLPAVLTKKMFHIQQAHLYHVLVSAIAIGESIMGIEASLAEYDQWLLDNTKARLNKVNQEYLLSFPTFVENLFRVATEMLQSTIPNNVVQILFGMVGPEGMEIFRPQIDLQFSQGHTDHPVYRVAVYCEKSARADAYLMLSSLLTGSCRKQMEELVVKHDLVRGLEKSIEQLVWDSLPVMSGLDDPRAEEFSGQEQSTKIHYFRLIFAIADHHVNRYLLLSRSELDEIEEIARDNNKALPEHFSAIDRTKCCQKKEGMLVEIIHKMKQETYTSHLRFWMARTVESFLRGSSCFYDQVFLYRRGLMRELIDGLLATENPSSDVIQGHFDLLSSLMKDNTIAFESATAIMKDSNKFIRLCSMIESNLVDSNMFVRSMILSMHHFESSKSTRSDFVESQPLLAHYRTLEKRIEVIYSLVSILDIKTLSQENVSCLNTSIIILLIADINKTLPKYLSALAAYSEESINKGKAFLRKLKDLLEFWLKHYSYSFKEQDVKSLEEVTGFEFHRWRELVNKLITNDWSSTSAIVRYLGRLDTDLSAISPLVPSCSRTC